MMHIFEQSWSIGPMSLLGFGAAWFVAGLVGILLILLVITLKGLALWHSARRGEKWWFVALLVINTFGILELCYLYFVAGIWHSFKDKKSPENVVSSTNTTSNSDKK